MLSTPDRSEMVSPRAVNISGTPAVIPPEIRAMRTACFNSSCIVGLPAERSDQSDREITPAQRTPPSNELCQRHEKQDQADDDEQEIGRQIGLLGGVLAADGQDCIEGDKWDDGERV